VKQERRIYAARQPRPARRLSCLGRAGTLPPPPAAKVAGSHLSSIATLGSLLKTWALAIVVPMAHKPTTTVSPTARRANFRIFLSSPSVGLNVCWPGIWISDMDLVGLGERPPITSLETPETLHDRGFAYDPVALHQRFRRYEISKQMDADLEAAANETNSVYLAEPLRADWENADFLDYAHFSAKGSRKLASSIAPRIAAECK